MNKNKKTQNNNSYVRLSDIVEAIELIEFEKPYDGYNSNKTCPFCKMKYKDHGMVETSTGHQIVCPGSYLVKNKNSKNEVIVRKDIFEKKFKKIKTDE